MTFAQSNEYERHREYGYEFDYTDGKGRIHMTKWETLTEARFPIDRISIGPMGDVSAET